MYKSLAIQLLFSSVMLVTSMNPRFEYPEEVPALERRQEPGTPRYQCHEDCGLLITLGRQDGYCKNSEWNERYGRCMICANTFGIWEYYGNSVTKAAKGCGLSPSPSPSGTTASGTSAGEQSTTTAGQPLTSTAPGQTSDIKTSSAAQTTGQNGSAVTSKAASTSGQISNTSTLSTVSTRASTPGVPSGPSSTPRPSASSTATPSSSVQSAAAGRAHFATPLMAAIVIALAGLC